MDEKKIFLGFGGLAALLLLVAIFMPRDQGPSVDDVVARALAPVSEQVDALNGRIDGVEASLGEMSEQIANAVSAEDLDAVKAQVEGALAETGSLSESLTALEGSLAEQVQQASRAASAAPAPAAQPETTETASTETAEASDNATGFSPGETALFADGALKLFVSRLDTEDKAAMVSVAGEMKTLRLDEGKTLPAGNDFCRVTLKAISAGGADIDGVCGADLPPPSGISAGKTALLADGAVRVFASLVTEDKARLSVNGDMHMLAVGRSVPALAGEETCRVYLDAVDRGHASVSALCGAEVNVSDVTGPGETVLLGDGAARVFVASVMEDAVRFAVNGQNTVTSEAGKSTALEDGCTVTVEDIAEGKASFSYACDG